MANKLRIKRRVSGSPGAPSTLENAELAFNEVDDILYYGEGTGGGGGTATTVMAIGGPGAFLTLSSAQTITGVKTFSAAPLVPTAAPGTSTTQAASTAFVAAAVTGGSVADGDKGDITVSGSGSVWTIDNKGAANGIATLDASGLVPTAQLPSLAITDTFVVANQAAMLALTAQVGDIAIRTDNATTYILQTAPATTLANWVALPVPAAAVSSVFSRTGAVVAASGDYTVAQVTGAAPTASPALTGTPTAPTATAGTSTTQLATTAFTTGAITTATALALLKANNLSDLPNAATARTNLGLGTMAVQNANAVAITGGTIDGITLDGGTF